jgi:hypothetical protein
MDEATPSFADFGVREAVERNACVGPPRRGARVYWTCREETILRAVYPRGGIAGSLEALPGRSAAAIYRHAGKMRLRWNGGDGPRRRRHWQDTPEIDAAIVAAYAKAKRKGHVIALAIRIGRPVQYVTRRAASLGVVVPRFKQPPWSRAENVILAHGAQLQPSSLRARLKRAGFARSEAAIKRQLLRIGCARIEEEGCSARELGALLGVGAHRIERWIREGLLPATPRSLSLDGAVKKFALRRRHIRQFVVDNAGSIDLRRADGVWLIDLLAGRDP